jgi:tRNA-uridine 2-sulfurtransferase
MKIAVAMSGGVDSAVVAALLKNEGHEIIGITADISSSMCKNFSKQSILDAKNIANQFKFDHHVISFGEDFIEHVVDPFCKEYLKGKTPNPCVNCNPKIKFVKLLEEAEKYGCSKLATGHYSKIDISENNQHFITTGKDVKKDQSYFLFKLPQNILEKIIFPLGDYTKENIRQMAKEMKLEVSTKPDSQEICFIPDDDYIKFIENSGVELPLPGNILNNKGEIIGEHKGIHRYTIGQRRGMGISAPNPIYVKKIDSDNNTIITGEKEDLYSEKCLVNNINFMKFKNLDNIKCNVKIRSTQKGSPCILKQIDNTIIVTFDKPESGITPGQAAVFYNKNGDILGGGTIDKIL